MSHLQQVSHFVRQSGSSGAALSAIWRRRGLVLFIIALAVTIGFVTLNQITPLYTATAKVMLVSPGQNITDMKQVVRSMRFNRYTMRGEIEVIRSRKLIDKLIERHNLAESAYFNPALRKHQPLFDVSAWIGQLKGLILGSPEVTTDDELALDSDSAEKRKRNALIDRVIGSLNVRSGTLSPVVEISFTTNNPRYSARLANALADLYVYNQLETKFEATRRATVWLNERLEDIKTQVRDSERAVQEYRSKHGLIAGKKLALTEENLSDLNSRYLIAQSERAEIQARYRQVQKVLKKGRGVETTADVLKSPVVQSLLDREASINRDIAELSNTYGERHPKMIDARSKLKDLERKLRNEVKKIASALKSELTVIQTREASLKRSLQQAKQKAATEGTASVALRELQREADANRLIYENFLSRFKETSQQESIQQADARVISGAAPPNAPSSPNKKAYLLAALGAGLLIGVMLVLFLEAIDTGLKSADEIENLTGLPVLTMVPMASRKLRGEGLPNLVLDNPQSSIAESIRNLHTSLRLASPDDPVKRVAFTSALAAEGKSTTCLWLAKVAASQGRRVVIVDCDLRRPKVKELTGAEAKHDMTEVIAGDVSVDEAIWTDEQSGVDVLVGKAVHGSALEILASDSFKHMVDELSTRYDLVLLDAPPVLAVSDVRVVARLVQTTVYLLQWNRTDAQTALSALKQLNSSDAKLLGIVVSKVNTRKHARYGYGDYGHYYGKTAGYYHQS